ncbi:MAG: AhpC/TSA family protein [Bacteroidales bacterium]|nr:AhpC/TSA family protein [Bacteroidales bacterium]
MRIQRIFIFMMLVTSVACSRNNIVIKGLVEGGDGTHITFERLDVNRMTVIDSVKIKKGGAFSFSTKLEEPELFILKNEQGDILNLLLSPGDHVSVSTKSESFGSDYTVEGSSDSENIRLLVEHLNRTRIELDSLLNLADSIEDTGNPQMDIIRNAYAQSVIKQKRFTISYLVQNMSSLSSVYALYQKFGDENLILRNETDLQYFIVVADSLEVVHPNSSLTKSLRADIERRQAMYRQTNQLNTLLDMTDDSDNTGLLDLTIADRDRNEITLSTLKGKVVLVVFWASGDEASIQSLLRLRSTYNCYQDSGFEIYAISLDNNKIRWMEAIDFNEFRWINVSELSYPDSRANLLYNVTVLPSSFLINREGDIVAKNLYGRTLETWLDNLL